MSARALAVIRAWLDADSPVPKSVKSGADADKIDFIRCIPFAAIHLGCFVALWTGVSAAAAAVAVGLYAFRVFALTAFYHRYFSHRSFKTNRFWQFVFAVWGMTAVQRGPLWWAAHHRRHHLHADTEEDAHSPLKGVIWSHFGWFTCSRNFATNYGAVPDFARYPELVWLNRMDWVVPVLFFTGLWFFGDWAATARPEWGTTGLQMMVWGGCISTVAVYHATFCVNSLCHLFGTRRYDNDEQSRNNWLVALLTFGEGWHNNHHRYPAAARQGFRWWELDVTYQILRLMSLLRIVHDLKPVPQRVLDEGKH